MCVVEIVKAGKMFYMWIKGRNSVVVWIAIWFFPTVFSNNCKKVCTGYVEESVVLAEMGIVS